MKRKILIFSVLMLTMTAVVLDSCKKSNDALAIGTLMAGSIDLNAAVAPTNVPTNPVITATFTTEVDPASATASNITLTEDYDDVSMPLTISVSGKVVTITPTPYLANGALYVLDITSGLKATNGEVLTPINRSFTTTGTFVPAGAVAYWKFDGNANDETGVYTPAAAGITAVTFVTGRIAAAGQAASFNGTTSLIQIPNGDVLENSSDFSISFWMKVDTTAKRQQFIMGLAASKGFQFEYNSNVYNVATPLRTQKGQIKLAAQYSYTGGTDGQDLWLDGVGDTKDNGSWQGWTFSKNLIANNGTGVNGLLAQKWAHMVCTYNHTTKIATMYINGEKMKEQDYNLYGAPMMNATGLKFMGNATNNALALGFIQDKVNPTVPDSWADYSITTNNHFKGLLDDLAIYHKVLTPSIITLMYNSGKP
jgi:hypothetical protein